MHGLSSSVSYNYDIANRLADVDGVPYVYDANGNLLNDGQNTYAYDSANRLSSASSDQGIVSSYGYNGLGDRLSQNGIQYTLDLNAGLTQVLDDGTNIYTYGLGRISQTNTTTDYFLGDALGSVRQLTDNAGEVTFAKSYDPYGGVTQSSGEGQSAYGYTGEQQDPTGLTYLRARYYASDTGHFISRDTWGGNYNQPLSLNRWNYVEGNPINSTDSSGHAPSSYCLTDKARVATAEFYVRKSSFDEVTTYVAAGIAVQCPGQIQDYFYADENSGKGIAQVSEKQAQTPWGEKVPGGNHGSGLLCYIVIQVIGDACPITVCAKEEEIAKTYPGANIKTEKPLDPTQPYMAVELMRRRIAPVVDRCNKNLNCSSTDKFIAAAFAQNGPGFMVSDLDDIQKNYMSQGRIDWTAFIRAGHQAGALLGNLADFRRLALKLNKDGYYLSDDYDNDAVIKLLVDNYAYW